MNQNIRQAETDRMHYATITNSNQSKNLSTAVKSSNKTDKKVIRLKPGKLEDDRVFRKDHKVYGRTIYLGEQRGEKNVLKGVKSKKKANQTANNSRRKPNIDSLVQNTLREYSTERQRRKEEERQSARSRRIQIGELKEFEIKTRERNLRRFPPSEENRMEERLPWGANETRIKKHVIQIIERLNKIRNPSKSSSKSPMKRSRKNIGVEFLDKLSPEKVQRMVLKSQRSSRDLNSSRSVSRQSRPRNLKTEMSQSRLPSHKQGIISRFKVGEPQRVLPSIKSSKNFESTPKRVLPK